MATNWFQNLQRQAIKPVSGSPYDIWGQPNVRSPWMQAYPYGFYAQPYYLPGGAMQSPLRSGAPSAASLGSNAAGPSRSAIPPGAGGSPGMIAGGQPAPGQTSGTTGMSPQQIIDMMRIVSAVEANNRLGIDEQSGMAGLPQFIGYRNTYGDAAAEALRPIVFGSQMSNFRIR